MNDFHKRLSEEREKQKNRNFLARKIFVASVTIAIVYLILKSSF